jgi:hypothetical protein
MTFGGLILAAVMPSRNSNAGTAAFRELIGVSVRVVEDLEVCSGAISLRAGWLPTS